MGTPIIIASGIGIVVGIVLLVMLAGIISQIGGTIKTALTILVVGVSLFTLAFGVSMVTSLIEGMSMQTSMLIHMSLMVVAMLMIGLTTIRMSKLVS